MSQVSSCTVSSSSPAVDAVEVSAKKQKNADDESEAKFSDFVVKNVLSSNETKKILCLEGAFKGKDEAAVIILEKKCFPSSAEEIQDGFFTNISEVQTNWDNDVYKKCEYFPQNKMNGENYEIL